MRHGQFLATSLLNFWKFEQHPTEKAAIELFVVVVGLLVAAVVVVVVVVGLLIAAGHLQKLVFMLFFLVCKNHFFEQSSAVEGLELTEEN